MAMSSPSSSNIENLKAVIDTVHRLRAPGGCPWDREQTHISLRKFLIEETYETVDVIDRMPATDALQDPNIRESFSEELGDVLLQVLLHSEIANETNSFSIDEVAKKLNQKLIHRHPHVFGDATAKNSGEVIANWDKLKQAEKGIISESVLDSVPRSLPTLPKTLKILEKVTKVGFQWKDTQGPLEKVEEELDELKQEIARYDFASDPDIQAEIRNEIEQELGDLLFSICNLAFVMKINPEKALHSMLHRFESRFRFMEKSILQTGKKMEESTLEEMDQWWNRAKAMENSAESSD